MATVSHQHLLLVEDDPRVTRNLIQQIHHYWADIIVDCAATLHDARQLIHQNEYHVWLVDIEIGDGKGTELFNEASIPPVVIGMSASTQDWMLRDRFTLFLQKPFTMEELRPIFG